MGQTAYLGSMGADRRGHRRAAGSDASALRCHNDRGSTRVDSGPQRWEWPAAALDAALRRCNELTRETVLLSAALDPGPPPHRRARTCRGANPNRR